MAIETFETVKPLLLAHEGGYSNDRQDPGNWTSGKAGRGVFLGTNYGIAAPTLVAWRGSATISDMKALTRDEALEIYKAQYWDTVKADELPAGVDYAVYDYSVNSGPGRAAKELQRVVGAKVDSVIGPATLHRIRTCGLTAGEIIDGLCDRRLAFMKSLRVWSRYKNGWSRRVSEVRAKAKAFGAQNPITDVVENEPVPVPRAKQADKSGAGAWKTPQGVATGVTAVSGLSGIISGSGPVQYALALVFVLAAATVAYLVINKFREED